MANKLPDILVDRAAFRLSAISRYVHDALHDLALTGGGAKRVLKSIPIIREILIELGYLDSNTPVPGLGAGQGPGGGGLLNQRGGATLTAAELNQANTDLESEFDEQNEFKNDTSLSNDEKQEMDISIKSLAEFVPNLVLSTLGNIRSDISGIVDYDPSYEFGINQSFLFGKENALSDTSFNECLADLPPQHLQLLMTSFETTLANSLKEEEEITKLFSEFLNFVIIFGNRFNSPDYLSYSRDIMEAFQNYLYNKSRRINYKGHDITEPSILSSKLDNLNADIYSILQVVYPEEFQTLKEYQNTIERETGKKPRTIKQGGANGNSLKFSNNDQQFREMIEPLQDICKDFSTKIFEFEFLKQISTRLFQYVAVESLSSKIDPFLLINNPDIQFDFCKMLLVEQNDQDKTILVSIAENCADNTNNRLTSFIQQNYSVQIAIHNIQQEILDISSTLTSYQQKKIKGELLLDFQPTTLKRKATHIEPLPTLVQITESQRQGLIVKAKKDIEELLEVKGVNREDFSIPDDDTIDDMSIIDLNKLIQEISKLYTAVFTDTAGIQTPVQVTSNQQPPAPRSKEGAPLPKRSRKKKYAGGFFQNVNSPDISGDIDTYISQYEALQLALNTTYSKGKISLRVSTDTSLGTIGNIINIFGDTNNFADISDSLPVYKNDIDTYLTWLETNLITQCESAYGNGNYLPYFGKKNPDKDFSTLKDTISQFNVDSSFNFGSPNQVITGNGTTDFKKLRTILYNSFIQTQSFIKKQLVTLKKLKNKVQMQAIKAAQIKAKADKAANSVASGAKLPPNFEIQPNFFESSIVLLNLAALFGIYFDSTFPTNSGDTPDKKIFRVFDWASRKFDEIHPKLMSKPQTISLKERIVLQLLCEIFTCGLFIKDINSFPSSGTPAAQTTGNSSGSLAGGSPTITNFKDLNARCRRNLTLIRCQAGNLDDKLASFTIKIFPKHEFGINQTELNGFYDGTEEEKNKRIVINNASNYSKLNLKYKSYCLGSSIWDPMSMCSGPSLIKDGLNYVVIGNIEHNYTDVSNEVNSMNSILRPKQPYTSLNAEVEGFYSTAGAPGDPTPHVFLYFPPKQVGMLSKELEAAKVYQDTCTAYLDAIKEILAPGGQGGGSSNMSGGATPLENIRQVLGQILQSMGQVSGNGGAFFELLERAVSRKMNGDFFQEVNSVYARGGYSGDITYFKNDPPSLVKFGDDYTGDNGQKLRMGFAGDRPSGIRMYIDLILGARGQMYKKDAQGNISERSSKQLMKEVINLYSFSGYIRPDKGINDCIVAYGHKIIGSVDPEIKFTSGIAGGAGGGKRRKRPRKKANKKKTQRKKSRVKRSRLYKKTLRKKLNKSNKKTNSKHKKRSTSKC